ncbi:hypothetical protein E4T49_00841 [Aureobasidium sp. EXF-10728]|nr:hypothetical protein E4T49_00841 [Aureobasidium sp. EXF-10728]
MRAYTAVSARTMAAVMAASENPYDRLCPNLPSQLPAIAATVQEKVDHRSIMQQLFNSESLRNIHSVEGTYSTESPGPKSEIEVSSAAAMSCDDLIKLCNVTRSACAAWSSSKQDGQLAHLYSRLRCLFSTFPSLAHSFSDDPMGVLAGPVTSHFIRRIRLHHVLELVHEFGQDASTVVFHSIWEALEPVFESPFDPRYQGPRTFQTFPSDLKGPWVIHVVHHAIHALTSFVPQASRETWHLVWSTIVNGKAYGKQKQIPDDPIRSPWLSILDSFEQDSAMRMAKRLIRSIGARTCLEETLRACGIDDAKPDPRLQPWKTSRRLRESITSLLVEEEQNIRMATFKTKYREELRHGGELIGTTSLIWLEWLRRCFLKEWDGSLQINRWTVAGSALELIEDLCKTKYLLLGNTEVEDN